MLLRLILTHCQLTITSMLLFDFGRRSRAQHAKFHYLILALQACPKQFESTKSARACIHSNSYSLRPTETIPVDKSWRNIMELLRYQACTFSGTRCAATSRIFFHKMSFWEHCRWRFCVLFVIHEPVNLHDQRIIIASNVKR